MKKGVIQILPVLILTLALVSGLAAVAISRSSQSSHQQVLSSADEATDEDRSGSNSQSSNSGSSSQDSNDDKNAMGGSSPNSNDSGSQNTTKVESKTTDSKTKVKTSSKKTEVKTESKNSRFETKIEDGRKDSKLRIGGLKIEYKLENGKVVSKIKNENNEEVDLDEDEKEDLFEEIESELEDDNVKIATDSTQLGIIQNGRRVRTNFPLSVNPQTGELTVSTPSGEKIVTVLPDVAIQNMIRAGFPIITTPSPSPEPSGSPEATPSATPEGTPTASPQTAMETADIELTQVNNVLSYIIDAAKEERLLGVLPVRIKVKGVVSATSGQLLELRRSFLSRLMDLLSF